MGREGRRCRHHRLHTYSYTQIHSVTFSYMPVLHIQYCICCAVIYCAVLCCTTVYCAPTQHAALLHCVVLPFTYSTYSTVRVNYCTLSCTENAICTLSLPRGPSAPVGGNNSNDNSTNNNNTDTRQNCDINQCQGRGIVHVKPLQRPTT